MAVKSVLVRLRGENGDLNRALLGSAAAARTLKKDLDGADDSGRRLSSALETSNDRTTMLIQGALALGPALVPLGAQAVPIITGLATQMGFAVAAAGTTVLAFQGVGKALKSVNDYAVEPTVANFQKMQEEMATLGPEGRNFVRFLQDLRPEMQELQNIAQAGFLPGLEDGIESFLDRGPQVERIINTLATTMGSLSAEAGDSLAGPEWDEFFRFVETEANPILTELSRSFGNILLGLANTTEAMGPLTSDFSEGLLGMSRDFVQWSDDLENSQGFQDFAEYVERTGPKVWETLGALADALLAILEAAAPIGEVSLPIIKVLAETLAAIAQSPAGPVLVGAAAGFSAVSRSIALYKAANGSALLGMLTGASKEGARAGAGLRAAGAGLGILALSMTDLDENAGLSNTAMFAMMGLVAGPWGAAIGTGVGLTMDLAAANNDLEDAVRRADAAMESSATKQDQRQAYRELKAEIDDTKQSYDDFWTLDPTVNGSPIEGLKSDMKALGTWLSGGTGDAETKLAMLGGTMKGTGDIADLFGAAVGMTGRQLRIAAGDAETLSGSLAELQGWLDKRAAIRNYEKAIDDLGAGLKKNAHSWDASTEAGRANLELVDNTTTGILQMAKTMKNADVRAKFLEGAKDDLRALAEQFPGARGEIRETIRQLAKLGLVDAKPKVTVDNKQARQRTGETWDDLYRIDRARPNPKIDADNRPARQKTNAVDQWLTELTGTTARPRVDADTSRAFDAISAVRYALAQLRDKTITINTVRQTSYLNKQSQYADGGYTGDGPKYEPRGVVHAGEVVIPKEDVQRDWSMLKARYGHLPGFDRGGFVQARPESRTVSSRVVERVVERMPDKVVLEAGGERFTAYVRREATDVARREVDSDARFQKDMSR